MSAEIQNNKSLSEFRDSLSLNLNSGTSLNSEFHWTWYVGRYHLSKTPFLHKSYTWPRFSLQSTPKWPSFFQNFNVKFQILRVLRAHFKTFVNFQLKMSNFHSNLIKFSPNDPLFWAVHVKKGPIFLDPTPNDPFFTRNLTSNAPCFRSPVDTYPSLSYSTATLPPVKMLSTVQIICHIHSILLVSVSFHTICLEN